MQQYVKKILKEVQTVLTKIDDKEVSQLMDQIVISEKIVTVGAGRMGMAARSFAMRLAHLGKTAYSLGDSNVPAIGKRDLLIAVSGSGETQTVYDLLKIAKKHQAKIALITGNRKSRMGKLADIIVEVFAQNKNKNNKFKSIQPMTTLNEQCAFIFFDTLVLKLMEMLNIKPDDMWQLHSVLE